MTEDAEKCKIESSPSNPYIAQVSYNGNERNGKHLSLNSKRVRKSPM